MSKENTYNGWTNWATWHVALLIDNEQVTSERQRTMAQHELKIIGAGKFEIERAGKWWKKTFAKQARETRNFARESWNEDAGEINWNEIAQNAIDEEKLNAQ